MTKPLTDKSLAVIVRAYRDRPVKMNFLEMKPTPKPTLAVRRRFSEPVVRVYNTSTTRFLGERLCNVYRFSDEAMAALEVAFDSGDSYRLREQWEATEKFN